MDQDATWYGGRPRLRDIVFDVDQLLPSNFWPMSIVATVAYLSYC